MTVKGKNIQQVGSGSIQGNMQMNFNAPVFGVAGNVEGDLIINSSAQAPNLAEAATEIQRLLQQLEQSYPVSTTSERMHLAAEAMRQIESNPIMYQKVFNALKTVGIEALEEVINHPGAIFLIRALEAWQTQ